MCPDLTEIIVKMALVQKRMQTLRLKLLIISSTSFSLLSCNPAFTHSITCQQIESCYDKATNQCHGHWTQVRAPGQPYPYTDVQGNEYLMRVYCLER